MQLHWIVYYIGKFRLAMCMVQARVQLHAHNDARFPFIQEKIGQFPLYAKSLSSHKS